MAELNAAIERDQYKFPMRLRFAMEHAATVLKNAADLRNRELDEDNQALVRRVLDELDRACIEANLAARRTAPVSSPIGEDIADISLPALPRPMVSTCHGTPCYTVGQMMDHARAAIAPYSARIRQLERELAERRPRVALDPEIKAALDEAAKTRSTVALLPDGEPVFINYGDQPEGTADISCTACGGSGHIDDQRDIASRAERKTASVDTPEFSELLSAYATSTFTEFGAREKKAALIAYIDAADQATRAQQQVQSVDTPEFRELLRPLLDAFEAWDESTPISEEADQAYVNLVAYIDGRTAGAAWISVEDSVPPLGEEVLVWCGYRVVGHRSDDQHDPENHDGWVIDFDNGRCKAITHWAPLPAVPTPLNSGKEEGK